ncbi:myo-inosose-2 dehydratase [Colwellia demingiae]|uniref:Myo-inosose-2 dehydratase n=1 Tax=Colwellia demingiae TaxID=89401 RepID=A0A5C6Q6D5_9GAMM|nr:myo-inosose-2 dehydratase [Colwellia demingiae]TWX64348.1 myo-inosose-2 dehydratase [Colwellia demingiae]
MSVKFGIAPIAWSNDDLPELGGETSLETCLKESQLAGFSGTETGGKFPMDPTILGPVLKKYSLDLVSGWFSGSLLENSLEEEKRRVASQLHTFRELGAQVLVYAETTGTVQNQQAIPLSRRPILTHDQIKAYGEKLTSFAEFMSSEGVSLSYHHHMGTVIETEEEVDVLMANTGDDVNLLLDTGHLVFAGGNPIRLLQNHGHRINHVHMKDIRNNILADVKRQDMSFLNAVLAGVFTVPGDGMIDYQSIANELREQNYSGWVVVEAEQDPIKAPPLKYAKLGFNHLKKVFEKAQFKID